MTGQSLFYMEGIDLKHKILAIAEEEGVARASYALKMLQSEGELAIASTGKDPNTGRLVTHEYRMEGPVNIFSTTTSIEVDEELLNRCIMLSANEDREQTRAIHEFQRQRRTLEGMLAKRERQSIYQLHCNAQRLLRSLRVINPYAQTLTFSDNKTRTRRDHEKYLTLIDAVTLLHQYQRSVKTVEGVEYLETTIEDIAIANRLANEVLGRSLDELLPQTRRWLETIVVMVKEACEEARMLRKEYRFSRRQLREYSGGSDTALKIHMARLVELEYLIVHRSERGQGFIYELVYEGQGEDGKRFLMGLIDVEGLKKGEEITDRSGTNGCRSGSGQPPVSPWSGGGQGKQNGISTNNSKGSSDFVSKSLQNAHIRERETNGAEQYQEAI
jgi:hypothetical protein